MRRRINRTLLTATAAGASVITLGFMATGAVGASTTTAGLASTSTVTPIPPTDTTCIPVPSAPVPAVNCAVAGWQATNRLFRYASASIVVPDHTGETPVEAVTLATTPATEADAALYVGLNDTSNTAFDYARAGVMPCVQTGATGVCPLAVDGGSGWELFSSVLEVDNGTGVPVTHVVALPPSDEGQGVSVSVYLTPTGNSVHTVITTPTTTSTSGSTTTTYAGNTYNHTFAVNGPTYTNAVAVADWTGPQATTQTEPYQPTALLAPTNAYAQFFKGRFTTWNGTKGDFTGKWITRSFEATLDGTLATSVVTSPSYLWTNDSFPGDAFGIWIRS